MHISKEPSQDTNAGGEFFRREVSIRACLCFLRVLMLKFHFPFWDKPPASALNHRDVGLKVPFHRFEDMQN